MGIYINTGNAGFQSARNSEYVDKSGLIGIFNSTLFTERRFSCVTRCRRFGKSMAAKMLCAYYDQSCDSRQLFADLPRRNVDSPAIVVELKCNKDADTAIDQIKRKQYPAKVAQYADRLLLVGISYDRKTKTHTCQIEKNTLI